MYLFTVLYSISRECHGSGCDNRLCDRNNTYDMIGSLAVQVTIYLSPSNNVYVYLYVG